MTPTLFTRASRRLLAKALAESCFEASFELVDEGDGHFHVDLPGAVRYRFRAWLGIWQWPLIAPDSITRNGASAHSPQRLLLDAQALLGIDDILLGNLLAELNNTLYSDARTLARQQAWPAETLTDMDGIRLQALLDGHPKLIAGKGRLGWDSDDLARYAPEADAPFRLRWLAVRQEACTSAVGEDHDWAELWRDSLGQDELARIAEQLATLDLDLEAVRLVPVHPWQWRHFLVFQYAEALARGELIDLGEAGGDYRAQLSLRTLSGSGAFDIKLALTLLNTSSFRGIPGKYIAVGPALGDWLAGLTRRDDELVDLIVQREVAGLHCPAPWQAELADTPYRYQEMLGAIWRESLEYRLKPGQQSRPLAAFLHQDAGGRSLIAAHVKRSGLDATTWLRRLFEVTAVPLYHLMCAYGVGVIAHGQNLTVVLENHVPVAAAIKDFHGDLRLWETPLAVEAGLPDDVAATLSKLPAHYLIHDLVTGYIVSTLRFISPLVARELDVPESAFYGLLRDTLESYQRRHPELAERFAAFDPFTPTLLRVCINRARYRIGYDDSAARPQPELGPPLANPLAVENGR